MSFSLKAGKENCTGDGPDVNLGVGSRVGRPPASVLTRGQGRRSTEPPGGSARCLRAGGSGDRRPAALAGTPVKPVRNQVAAPSAPCESSCCSGALPSVSSPFPARLQLLVAPHSAGRGWYLHGSPTRCHAARAGGFSGTGSGSFPSGLLGALGTLRISLCQCGRASAQGAGGTAASVTAMTSCALSTVIRGFLPSLFHCHPLENCLH